jgi:hypothetical protein
MGDVAPEKWRIGVAKQPLLALPTPWNVGVRLIGSADDRQQQSCMCKNEFVQSVPQAGLEAHRPPFTISPKIPPKMPYSGRKIAAGELTDAMAAPIDHRTPSLPTISAKEA